MRRANRLVGAIAANEARLRGELSARMSQRPLAQFLRFVQLLRVSRGFLPLIVLQIMEYSRTGFHSKISLAASA